MLLGLVSEVLDALRQYFDIQANVVAQFPLQRLKAPRPSAL